MDLNSRMTFGDEESYFVDSFVPITPGKTFPGTSNSSRVSMNGQSNRENWGELSAFSNPNYNPAIEKFGEVEQLGFNSGNLIEKNRMINQIAGAYSQALQNESVGWNGSFLSLLEMTNDINSNESRNLHSWEPNSSEFLLANQTHSSNLDILAGIPQYGFPVSYNPQYDLNSLPSTETYGPSSVTNSFQFEPVTPNEKWTNGRENQKYISAENVTDVSIYGVPSRNHVDTSSAIISVLSEEPKDAVVSKSIEEPKDSCVLSDEIIDLNKTPQQKAQKRRKHRPKVIVEGKAKRTPKAADTESKVSEKKPKAKRKYARKELKQSAAENADNNGVKAYETTTTAKPSCKKALNFDSEAAISRTENNPLNKEVETSKLSTSFQVADQTNPADIISRRESSLQKSQQNKQMPETSEAISNLAPSINLMAANSASNLGRKAGFSNTSVSNRMGTDLNASTRDTIVKNQQFLSSDMTGHMIFHFNPYSRFPPYYDGSRSSKREYHQIMQSNGTHNHHGQEMRHTNSYSLNGSIPNEVSSETRKKRKIENGNTANIDGSFPYASAVDHSSSSNVNSLACALQTNNEALNGVNEFNRFPVHSSTRLVVSGQDKSKQNMTGSRSLREILHGSPASVNTIVACNMVPPTPVASSRHKGTMQYKNSMNLLTRQEIIPLQSKADKICKPELQVFSEAQSPGKRKEKPKFPVTVEDIIYQMESLYLNGTQGNEKNALMPYRGDGTLIPFEGVMKKRKPRPKVELDAETERVWKLLMWKEGSEDQGTDEEKRKWWDEERRVFRGRADSFIARMHLVQGDRRFSKWKGSVVDSVIGVFLTQNVSDHLSSSAFMSLASRFPPKPATERTCQRDGTIVLVEEPDLGLPNLNEMLQEKLLSHPFYTNSSVTPHGLEKYQLESETSCTERTGRLKGYSHSPEEVLSSQDFFNSSISQSNGLRSCSGSNSEAEEPTNGDKCNKYHRTCSADLLAESTTSFAEFYSKISGKSLFLGESRNEQRLQRVPTVPSNNMSNSRVLAVERLNFNREESISSTSGSTRYQETPLMGSYRSQAHDMNLSFLLESQSTNEPVILSHEQANKQYVSNIPKLTGKSLDGESQIRLMGNQQKPSENKLVESGSNDRVTNEINSNVKNIKERKDKGKANGEKKDTVDWDSLRKQVLANSERKEKSKDDMDSLDYEAMRSASVNKISDTIRERGMNNMLAERIKQFLDRLVRDHGSVDLEWLRDVPPDKAKEYLLSIRGLGLKSVECVRLLTLHHLAFPVDTNVGRIAVRLGWVPLQPLPESLQLHLLELYPILESIQKYLWPRLCKLDQRTLYELHYQMITFGKVFCTKSRPNCNACPMRAECRHFASAFASARLALPGPEEKSIVNHTAPLTTESGPGIIIDPLPLPSPVDAKLQRVGTEVVSCVPIIEEPSTPEQQQIELIESDIEDLFNDDGDEIPTIKLNMEELSVNLQNYMESNMDLQEFDMSKALVALNPSAASIPTPKLKNISRLRTEHNVYELPDSHPLLNGMDKREPDDPSPYLLAIWTPGETAESVQPPGINCQSQEPDKLCNEETCFSCNSVREANSQIVRGTILIPCRTAMRGSFPLNGTYFQVNEMFADHASSLNPIDVPRAWIWNLPRRMVYFGTSVSTIFKGLSTEQIQYCFWRGFVCVRGFYQQSRAPRPLLARFHFPASKLAKTKNVP